MSNRTRRHLLLLGGIGLFGTLAGCIETDSTESEPVGTEDPPDRSDIEIVHSDLRIFGSSAGPESDSAELTVTIENNHQEPVSVRLTADLFDESEETLETVTGQIDGILPGEQTTKEISLNVVPEDYEITVSDVNSRQIPEIEWDITEITDDHGNVVEVRFQHGGGPDVNVDRIRIAPGELNLLGPISEIADSTSLSVGDAIVISFDQEGASAGASINVEFMSLQQAGLQAGDEIELYWFPVEPGVSGDIDEAIEIEAHTLSENSAGAIDSQGFKIE